MTMIIIKALLHRPVAATINFPPQLRSQASRPIYSLLGFSAALAPKFTHSNQDFGFNKLGLVQARPGDNPGKINEFKVFIRPLQGVNMIHKLMQGMMESFKNVS